MPDSFWLGAIPVELEFRRGLKTMRLTVYPGGRVKIASPPGTAPQEIRNFALSKIKWIEEHRKKFLGRTAAKPDLTLRNNSSVYVWGAAYELMLIERSGNSKIALDGGCMKMYVRPLSPKAKKQEILDRFYRRILKEAAGQAIKKWEAIIGVEVKKLYVRKMKSHWGSCNYKRQTLRLNSELAKRNPDDLEYVIVHEMLHIVEKGHNRKFYRLLTQYIPNWKDIRKKMNSGDM